VAIDWRQTVRWVSWGIGFDRIILVVVADVQFLQKNSNCQGMNVWKIICLF
jgi:hypothetical protein